MIEQKRTYHIFERTDKGEFKSPTHRPMYEHWDTETFYSSGYESEELALKAIARHLDNECGHYDWPTKKAYFILPQIEITFTPETK